MALENFKITANRIQFGVRGTVTANVAQSMEQEYRFEYKDIETNAYLCVYPHRAILTIYRDKMHKTAIQELIDNCTLLKGKKYDGFKVTKEPHADLFHLSVTIDFL